MERQVDLVVIGAGPAGLTAALYASRAGLKTMILESGAPGGKLVKTHQISNYPGVKTLAGTWHGCRSESCYCSYWNERTLIKYSRGKGEHRSWCFILCCMRWSFL